MLLGPFSSYTLSPVRATAPEQRVWPQTILRSSSRPPCYPEGLDQELATHQSVFMVQMKNWEPLVLGPALAMDRTPAKTSGMSRLPQEGISPGNCSKSR